MSPSSNSIIQGWPNCFWSIENIFFLLGSTYVEKIYYINSKHTYINNKI